MNAITSTRPALRLPESPKRVKTRSDFCLPEMSFFFVGETAPLRRELEYFVSAIYRDTYGAEIQQFHEVLVGCGAPDGELQAVLGLTPLNSKKAFLEQYLDHPIEQLIFPDKEPVKRDQIVELGNLSARVPGAARSIIRYMTRYLHTSGYKYVVFTATQALANSFARLHYEPRVLAKADPRRLSVNSGVWGTYYESNPQVMVGDVRAAYAALF